MNSRNVLLLLTFSAALCLCTSAQSSPSTEVPGTSPPPTEVPGTSPPATTEVPGTNPPATTEVPGTNPPATTEVPGTNPPATTEVPGTSPPATTEEPETSPPATTEVPETSPPPSEGPQCPHELKLDDTSGTFSSPGFDEGKDYPDNAYCSWTINVCKGSTLTLNFTVFETAENDFVKIYCVRRSGRYGLQEALSGDKSGEEVTLKGKVKIVFTSNECGGARGFTADYVVQKGNGRGRGGRKRPFKGGNKWPFGGRKKRAIWRRG